MDQRTVDNAMIGRASRSSTVVELRDISKSYGDIVVIDHLSLKVGRGEFLTLLGPSGCGKTTLLKMIGGFERPTSGEILLDGREVSRMPPYKRNLNTVFQRYALFPHMTVFDNIAFGPRAQGVSRGEARKRVDAMLRMVDMREHARKRPFQLSGGQQQRVALARALVNSPSALLLDEPLSALDAKLRRSMQIELKRIQAEVHTTFIFVTHDQEEALTMSSRIAVMKEGKIEQLATPMELYDHPATPFVAQFIGAANLLKCTTWTHSADELLVNIEGYGHARLRAGKQLPSDAGGGLLMLRPERLEIREYEHGDEERANHLVGYLRQVVFRGVLMQYVVEAGVGCSLTVMLPPRSAAALEATVNGRVTVSWDEGQGWLIGGWGPIPSASADAAETTVGSNSE